MRPSSLSVPGARTRIWIPPHLCEYRRSLIIPGRAPDPIVRRFWRDYQRRWTEVWREIWRDLPLQMAIAHVGTDASQMNQTGSTSYTLTLLQQASAGNMLVVYIGTDNGGVRLPTTVSGGGLTGWTQQLSATESVTGSAGIAIWTGFNASGSGGTSISISGNINSGDHWGFMSAEFSGVTSTLDQTASTAVGTANGSIATPTITTTNANDLLLAVFSVNRPSQTYTGSWTSADSQPTDLETGQATMGAVYNIVSAAGAQSTTWNNSGGAASWCTGIMALQASVAAGTIIPVGLSGGMADLVGGLRA